MTHKAPDPLARIADFLFEARMLKEVPRTGYQFLGMGRESVAEHSYMTAMLGYILSDLVPEADSRRLVIMCLAHDIAEARIGDLNYVQKFYVTADEPAALADALEDLPFAEDLETLLTEFNAGQTLEAQLARDADQISLILELKALKTNGYTTPESWLPNVHARLKTDAGRNLAEAVLKAPRDRWWRNKFVDT
ncbi:MAG: HD domain-containing protein [Desulfobacterales bacterium]